MRKITPFWQTAIMFCLVMVLSMQAFTQIATPPSAGDGSESNPYRIATIENLCWLTQNITEWKKHYIQVANINASGCRNWDNGKGFIPIGGIGGFGGKYNGKGHIIDSIYINRPSESGVGFFGSLNYTAKIDSLGVTNIFIKGYYYVGGLVGELSRGQITNCYSTGTCFASGQYCGGLIGENSIGKVSNCYSEVNTNGSNYSGGLVGRSCYGLITNSYSSGDVDGGYFVGGLVGINEENTISYCYSRSNRITASGNVGGLIGYDRDGIVESSFWDLETSGQSSSQGGLGLTTSEMRDSMIYINAGWDLMNETTNGTNDTWGINSGENNGYPFLKWQKLGCQAPFFSVKGVVINGVTLNSISLDSLIASGYNTSGYCIYINSEDNWSVPENGIEPFTNATWQSNSQQCIYFGTSLNLDVIVTGLLKNTRYYIKVFGYNDCNGVERYEQTGKMISIITETVVSKPNGRGSKSNPYIIANIENLAWIMYSDTEWDKHYIQSTDIDASISSDWNYGNGFTPIGNSNLAFTGIFNGKGNAIDQITINRPEDNYIGLFGKVVNAKIDSLGLTSLNITGGSYLGGLVGYLNGGEITNCFATGECISMNEYAGGLVGLNKGNINYSYSHVNVNSTNSFIGGFVGKNYGGISWSYSTGIVTGNSFVGGLVGYGEGEVDSSFWDTETSGQIISEGGVGLTTTEMKDVKTYLGAGWDFMDEIYNGTDDIWGLNSNENDGYPFLQWQRYLNVYECQAPFFPADSIIIGDNLGDRIILESFTKAGYGAIGYSVYINTEDNWDIPIDGLESTVNNVWQNNGQQCIYFGTSINPNTTVTGLSEETKYYFRVYAYNDCSGVETYEQIGTVASIITKVVNIVPDGDGSEDNPYMIANLENLAWLMYNDTVWNKYFIQTANIDASPTSTWDQDSCFTPIGNSTTPFIGSYNGKEYKIDQLNINRPGDSLIGLFGNVYLDARIENLGLTNIDIIGGSYVGSIAGFNYGGKIINSYSTGTCIGSASDKWWGATGGLVGYNIGAITCCYSDVNVSSIDDIVGGLAGVNEGYIYSSYSTGDAIGNNYVGGLLGVNFSTMVNCYSRSEVQVNTNYCGGLVGDSYGGYALSSFWDTETSDQNTSYGGEGLSTLDMQDINTYVNAGWDFMDETSNGLYDFWGLNSNENNGYPFLYWQGYTNTATISTNYINVEERYVSVYPNPVSSILNIKSLNNNINRILISDITGKIVVEKAIISKTEYVDMSTFKPGVYLIRIYKDKDEVYTSKIIKK